MQGDLLFVDENISVFAPRARKVSHEIYDGLKRAEVRVKFRKKAMLITVIDEITIVYMRDYKSRLKFPPDVSI